MRGVLTRKEYEGAFWGDENVLCVDFGASCMSIPGYYNSLGFTSNKANLYSSKADWKLNKTESPVEPVETLLCLTQGGSDSAWGLGSGKGQTAFLTNCQVNRRLPVGEPTWRTTIWTDIGEEVLYSVHWKRFSCCGLFALKTHQSPMLIMWVVSIQPMMASWVLPRLLEALDPLPWEGNSFPHYAGKRSPADNSIRGYGVLIGHL